MVGSESAMAPVRSLPVIAPLVDGFARKIDYLRVSLTDRCNFRCTYCMPENMQFRPRTELLTFEEIARIVSVFTRLGVRRVRLTGGEPTVRADLVTLVEQLHTIEGLESIVMTSNGELLPVLAPALAKAGLDEVNISLDTLDADKFRELTRRGDLTKVIAGVSAALAAGLKVKLNIVALTGVNDEEVGQLCAFAWERGIVPRFIEHMPMSSGMLYDTARQLTAEQIRHGIAKHFRANLLPSESLPAHGPSRYWQLEGELTRRFGIISAMSEHFCDTCNRVRLSATGDLHTCLAYDDAVSLRDLMRSGGSDDDAEATIRAVLMGKRVGHEFQTTGAGGPTKHMISIGG